jgi:hypothetical protein
MPVIDNPYHFVKWTMPTEVVWSNPNEPETRQAFTRETPNSPVDQRGGSHVIRWGEYYLCFTHEVKLWRNYLSQKDSVYRHRVVVWDKDFNFKGLSNSFAFMDVKIEFCTGAAVRNDNLLVSFSVADNAAFILEIPQNVVNEMVTEALSYVG